MVLKNGAICGAVGGAFFGTIIGASGGVKGKIYPPEIIKNRFNSKLNKNNRRYKKKKIQDKRFIRVLKVEIMSRDVRNFVLIDS